MLYRLKVANNRGDEIEWNTKKIAEDYSLLVGVDVSWSILSQRFQRMNDAFGEGIFEEDMDKVSFDRSINDGELTVPGEEVVCGVCSCSGTTREEIVGRGCRDNARRIQVYSATGCPCERVQEALNDRLRWIDRSEDAKHGSQFNKGSRGVRR